jgi:hypothetical protein
LAANDRACSFDRRLSLGSAIHSRMIVLRASWSGFFNVCSLSQGTEESIPNEKGAYPASSICEDLISASLVVQMAGEPFGLRHAELVARDLQIELLTPRP